MSCNLCIWNSIEASFRSRYKVHRCLCGRAWKMGGAAWLSGCAAAERLRCRGPWTCLLNNNQTSMCIAWFSQQEARDEVSVTSLNTNYKLHAIAPDDLWHGRQSSATTLNTALLGKITTCSTFRILPLRYIMLHVGHLSIIMSFRLPWWLRRLISAFDDRKKCMWSGWCGWLI